MNSFPDKNTSWPSLSYNEWKDTRDTLHMWIQIVGKVKLALSPFQNQWWEVTFHLTARGITTGPISYKKDIFDITFDFITHRLVIAVSNGEKQVIKLKPQSVPSFYKEFFKTLKSLDIVVTIYPVPVEIPNPIPFLKDTQHKSYNKKAVEKWWTIQYRIASLFDIFRSEFRGKSSPTQFFWGSFDLSQTRFSGKKAPAPKAKGTLKKIMRYAENEENFAIGFWPGDERFPHPAIYSYIYPAPKGFETIKTGPIISYFNQNLSECILPYEDMRRVKNSEKEILNFLQTSYEESAKLAGWDILELKNSKPF